MQWFLSVVLPCNGDIPTPGDPSLARICVSRPNSGQHRHPWSTARAEIAQQILSQTGLRSRFPTRASSMLQKELHFESQIYQLIPTLSSANPSADSCFWTAQTPLIDCQFVLRPKSLRRRSVVRAWAVDSKWEPPPCFRRSDSLNRRYLSKSRPFPRADSCFQTAQTPLINSQGRNCSAAWA